MKGKTEGHTDSGKVRTYSPPDSDHSVLCSSSWSQHDGEATHGAVVGMMGQCLCHG